MVSVQQGHEVIIVDRQNSAAEETSAGNAGSNIPDMQRLGSAGYSIKAVNGCSKNAPLAIKPDGSLFQLRDGQMLRIVMHTLHHE